MRIECREIADGLLENLKIEIEDLKKQNIQPQLAIILVGNNPQSISYVEQKEIKANKIGVKVLSYILDQNISQEDLLKPIEDLNNDRSVHGIIVQRPLPSHINSNIIDSAVVPQKDIDGFNPESKFSPPLGNAVIEILKKADKNFKNKKIAIIGKGETGGRPVMQILEKMNIPFQIIDSKTENKNKILKNADIIISAVGKSNILSSENIKRGVTLISVGLHKGQDGKLHGDYNEEEIRNLASFYTPTPGGVGPVNVAMLLKNLVDAASNRV